MVLNLDSSFKPLLLQEIEFEAFTFSGGEPHVKLNTNSIEGETAWVTHRITTFNDLGLLFVACDALRRAGIQSLNLFLPYFPGARQDRVMVSCEPLTAKVYADLINQLHFIQVVIFDPHSEVVPALLNNCVVLNNYEFINWVYEQIPASTLLVAPDGGSLKKIYGLSAFLNKYSVVECRKHRNTETGKIDGFTAFTDDLNRQHCLIVDDICDGGATFIGIAKTLKEKNAGDLYLAVSHGIFSKGLNELQAHFKNIFTTNSFPQKENSFVSTFNLAMTN